MKNEMRPVHPGEILKDDVLAELGMSANGFAQTLGVPANRISAIVAGKRAVSAETALRLARYLGGSAQFWLDLQSAFDLRSAEIASGRRIALEVRPRAA